MIVCCQAKELPRLVVKRIDAGMKFAIYFGSFVRFLYASDHGSVSYREA